MHFEYFPAISECWYAVWNDKRETQARQEQAWGSVLAAAVKYSMDFSPICLVLNIRLRPY